MHESGPAKSLVREIEGIARGLGNPRVLVVHMRLGVLCPFSEDSLRAHFEHVAEGTVAENAMLVINWDDDPTDPGAQSILLESLAVEELPVFGYAGESYYEFSETGAALCAR
jgi:hydrogenase nickel incorporation protein HypA/HybF